ncbi:MAG: hypothetical protein RLZZ44_1387 [Bacteroidota bacterium]|jgi:glycosyltransferase involved in cell wall biosynthesis
MHFTLITGIYYPDVGGPATFIPKLAGKLIDHKHEILTISLGDRGIKRKEEVWKRIFVLRSIPKIIRLPITIIVIILNSLKSDVILANGLHEETAMANLILRKKLIFKIVGDPIWERAINRNQTKLGIDDFNSTNLKSSMQLQRRILNWSMGQADIVITPSKQLAQFVVSWNRNAKTLVIPNGIETPIINKNNKKEFDVIFFGRLTKWKEIRTIIDAIKICRKKLIIIGDGPEKSSLSSYAQTKDADVTFLGEKDRNEIFSIAGKCRIFCLASSYEGLSHALLEAMALELPVIVSNIEANLDVIENGKTGLVFELNNSKDLAEKIDYLLNSQDTQDLLRKNALHEINNKYTENVILERYIKILETV